MDVVEENVTIAVKALQQAAIHIKDRESLEYKRVAAALLALGLILEERFYFDARTED
jgi:hypothetical protein